jgi:hypothetical protein
MKRYTLPSAEISVSGVASGRGVYVMAVLSTGSSSQAALSLSDSETAQAIYVFRSVKTLAVLITSGEGQRS